jgi:hypothetical protein
MENKGLVLRIVGGSVMEILAALEVVKADLAAGLTNCGNGQYDWDLIDTNARTVDDPSLSLSALAKH